MTLSPEARLRFARHLLLPEIGLEGQERLSAACVSLAQGADVRAAAVAREYLERAGLRVQEGAPRVVPLPSAETVESEAGGRELVEAEAALRGALAAVREIRELTSGPRTMPSEDARG